MRHLLLFFLSLLLAVITFASDTLYFRISNPWNTVKDANGNYLRKCVAEKDYFHCWDFNTTNNRLVTESFYSDTSFTRKLFCHSYYDENTGLLEQSRCYNEGRLHGYFVNYNAKGDTTSYTVYENGNAIKEETLIEGEGPPPEFIKVEQEASFPGGDKAWLAFAGEKWKVDFINCINIEFFRT